MTLELIFKVANLLALVGWVVLLLSPLIPRLSQRISGLAIPLLMAIAYTGLVMAFWSRGQGGFGSLDAVATLFHSRALLLAGWIYYLAFDLFVGASIARAGRESGVWFAAVVPCLILTFLFGPAGYLLFNVMRTATRLPSAGHAHQTKGARA